MTCPEPLPHRSSIVQNPRPQDVTGLTVGDFVYDSITAHIAWCVLRNLRPNTLRGRKGELVRLARVVGDPLHVSAPTLRAWWDARHVQPNTRVTTLAHLSSFFRWAVLEELRVDDPTVRIPRPRVQDALPRPTPEHEVRAALERAERPLLDWLCLAGYAGFRAFEIAGLRGEHYEPERQTITVVDGKGGRSRVLPVHPRIGTLAVDWPTSGPVWHDANGNPFSPNNICQRTNRWIKANGGTHTIHRWRARFLTAAYRVNRDLRETQELAGHASPSTTVRYVQVAEGVGRSTVLALD